MQKKYIFILFVYIIFVTLFIISFVKSNVFLKRTQKNKIESLESGFGYYDEEEGLGCEVPNDTGGGTGREMYVKKCILNPTNGNFCVNEDGEFSSKHIYYTKHCKAQNYSSYLMSGNGKHSIVESMNQDGSVTQFNSVIEGSQDLKIINKTTGIDYTDYFLDTEGNLKTCIPDDFVGYNVLDLPLHKTDLSATVSSNTVRCVDYNNQRLKSDKDYIDVYPVEKNNFGKDKKVCYDLNNFNQVEPLNHYDYIPPNFTLPQECYKHSIVKDYYKDKLELWPGSISPKNVYKNGIFTKNTEYFSLIGEDLKIFEDIISQIGTSNYDIQKDYKSYIKCFLNSETSLVDTILEAGTCYIEKLDDNIIYVKFGVSYGMSSKSEYLTSLINNPGVSNTVNYLYSNIGVSQYINIGADIINVSIDTGVSYFIDSEFVKPIPFSFLSNIPIGGMSMVEIKTFNDQNLLFKNLKGVLRSYGDFNKLYKWKGGDRPDEILFTNNCTIDTNKLLDSIDTTTTEEYIINKNPPDSDGPFYYYGVSDGIYGYYYNLIYQPIDNEEITIDGYTFGKIDPINFFNKNYNPCKECTNFKEYIGIGSVKINYKRTSDEKYFPCDLELISRGMTYTENKEYDLGDSGICVNVKEVSTNRVVNIKLLRNNDNNLFKDIGDSDENDYIEDKLFEHSKIIKDQHPTGSDLENNSIIILPESSVIKVIDLDVFKTPYELKDDKTKNYFCFNNIGIFDNRITYELKGESIKYKKFTDYPTGGICARCGVMGVEYNENIWNAVQERTLFGIALSEGCSKTILEEKDYRSFNDQFEPCLQERQLEIKESETKLLKISNGGVCSFKDYYTESIKPEFIYAKNQEYYTDYSSKRYFLNSSERPTVNFFNNFSYVQEKQIISENFINEYVKSNINEGLGFEGKVYSNNNISNNYGKQINYQVSSRGIMPYRPSDSGVNFFYGKYQDQEFDTTSYDMKVVMRQSLSRNPFSARNGEWLYVKDYTPIRIQTGIDRNSEGIWTLKARLFDDTLFDEWSDVEVGDFINPSFSFFNKIFYGMVNDNAFEDYIVGVDFVFSTGSNIMENTTGDTDPSYIDSYFVLVPSEKEWNTRYPILEVIKILGVVPVDGDPEPGNGFLVKRNINNENKTSLYPDAPDAPNAPKTEFTCFNLGKNTESSNYNVINNFYKIDTVGRDRNYEKPYVAFNFDIPSITNGVCLSAGVSFETSIVNFFSKKRQPFDDVDEHNPSEYDFENSNPSLTCRYLKNKITFPTAPISDSNLNTVLFSNENNPKLNKNCLSYMTSIRKFSGYYYINEFRENYTFFNKQVPLSFSVGDTIKHFTKILYTGDSFGVSGGASIGAAQTVYELKNTYKIEETSVALFEGVSDFMTYDYKCSGNNEIGVCGVFYNSGEGTSSIYANPETNLYQLRYSTDHPILSEGVSLQLDSVNHVIELNKTTFPKQILFDYYKISKGDETDFDNVYSDALRTGKADVLQLYKTNLTSGNTKEIKMTINKISGKPYGIDFMLSSPMESEVGISTRLNYESYSNIKEYEITNSSPNTVNKPIEGDIFESKGGIKLLVGLSISTAELEFKTVENYKTVEDLENEGTSGSSDLQYLNENTKQYYKNFGVSNKINEGSWKIVPKTFYTEQNYIKGVIGNFYNTSDTILNETDNMLYKHSSGIQELFKLEGFNSTDLVEFKDSLIGRDNNFYTFVGLSGISSFLSEYKNTEDFINLNNQNLPLRIRTYDTGNIGQVPEVRSYYDKGTCYSGANALYLSGVSTKIFEDLCLLEFGDEKLISLGHTPVPSTTDRNLDINYLEDVGGIAFGGNDTSQYFYSIKSGANNIDFYNKSRCIGDNNIGSGDNPGVSNVDFSNGVIFKFTPNALDSQDHIPYIVDSVEGGLSVITLGDNFPIYGGDCFGISGTSVSTLDSSGVSFSGVSFSFTNIYSINDNAFNWLKHSRTFQSGMDRIELKIGNFDYNVFKIFEESDESDEGGKVWLLRPLDIYTSDYMYGDYWYIEDEGEIITFGYINPLPAPHVGKLSMRSFVQLKKLENNYTGLTIGAKINIITDSGKYDNPADPDISDYILNNTPGDYQFVPTDFTFTTQKEGTLSDKETFFENAASAQIVMNVEPDPTNTYKILSSNKAVISGMNYDMKKGDKIYMPITPDFYTHIKCKAICTFGSTYLAKLKYTLDKKVLGLDNKTYSPIIFDPYQTEVFEPDYKKVKDTLFEKNAVSDIENVNDCFILTTSNDNKIDILANPFLLSISNNECKFGLNAFGMSGTSLIPVLNHLSVINSESIVNLISRPIENISFKPLNFSISDILSDNEKYEPLDNHLVGYTNTRLQFQELRENEKKYYIDEGYDCNFYFRKIFLEQNSTIPRGGGFTLEIDDNKRISIPNLPLGGMYINNDDNFYIAKNLEYIINIVGGEINFGTTESGLNLYPAGNGNLIDVNDKASVIFKKEENEEGVTSIKFSSRVKYDYLEDVTIYYSLKNNPTIGGKIILITNKRKN